MQSKALSVEEYLEQVAEDKKATFVSLRNIIKKNIPKGFEERMSYGMLGYVVPHDIFPSGYHCDPKLPLPFVNLAAQKNFIAIYHMGIYASPELMEWFTSEHAKRSTKKLDMGKSCIRYKKPEDIPVDLIGELMAKMSVQDWISVYTTMLNRNKK